MNDPLDDELIAFLDLEARARARPEHANHRPLSDNYDRVGMFGEVAFAKQSGLPLALERRGDGGVDFIAPLRFTIDVKTSRKPFHLIVEQGKLRAQIYVLAQYLEQEQAARLLGWERAAMLARTEPREFSPGIASHHIACEELRPMSELLDRIMRLK